MKNHRLEEFKKGWFIGDFSPSILDLKSSELAIKRYKAGDYEPLHHHKIATEVTVIIEGCVEMNGKIFVKNDIIIIYPNESTDFKCLNDTVTCVFKNHSVANDKYFG